MTDKFARRDPGNIKIKRSCRMVLDPLTEVVIGVFMAVKIRSGQFMMDLLRDCKRSKGQQ